MAGLSIMLVFFAFFAIPWSREHNRDFKSIREDNERLAEIDREQC